MVVLDFRPGDYVVKNGAEIGGYPAGSCDVKLEDGLRKSIVLGIHRTPLQDPIFSIRHLVEVVLRALSPGVNDPYTATAVLDRLSRSLAVLMTLSLPSGIFRNASRPRLGDLSGTGLLDIRWSRFRSDLAERRRRAARA